MTEETYEFIDEMADDEEETLLFTERVSVAGSDLVATLQALLREAAVRKITVKDKTGRTLLEFPLYAGVIGTFMIGYWTVLALIAAWFAEVSILIERDQENDDQGPSLSGEYAERAADSIKTISHKAPESVKTAVSYTTWAVGGTVGGAARSASDLAKRAADTLEERLRGADVAYDEAAEATTAYEPQQCVALTKAGTRCKRGAMAGADYCSTHQPLAN
jgi:hypothetical protein